MLLVAILALACDPDPPVIEADAAHTLQWSGVSFRCRFLADGSYECGNGDTPCWRGGWQIRDGVLHVAESSGSVSYGWTWCPRTGRGTINGKPSPIRVRRMP